MSLTGVTSKVLPHKLYSNQVGNTDISSSNHAPKNDAKIAGIPNRNNTVLSVFFPTKAILNRLLEKCTTPVKAIATSIGKKIANTGAKIVPSPNPEKKVSIAVKKAAITMIMISMMFLYFSFKT